MELLKDISIMYFAFVFLIFALYIFVDFTIKVLDLLCKE